MTAGVTYTGAALTFTVIVFEIVSPRISSSHSVVDAVAVLDGGFASGVRDGERGWLVDRERAGRRVVD
jgi:hypothetical protein